MGVAHYAVTAVLLKAFGLALPCCLTGWYSDLANFLLYLCVARFTFVFTKKWYLNERLPPENRAIFITGCDSGFGHNVAKLLDSNGYPVFAGCLDPDGSGAKELKRSCSKRLQIVGVDVTKDSSVKKAADFVRDNLGTAELWAIVNNAGILRGFEVELTDLEYFKETMEVNGFGPVRVTKAFLSLLRQSRGRIVNITSLGSRIVMPYITPYIMSKYAALGFTDCLRLEMDVWGIRVISIEPEFFRTDLSKPEMIKKHVDEVFEKADPDVREDYGEKYIRNFKLYGDIIRGGCSASLDPVTDAVHNAVGLKYPNSVYQPNRNVFTQMLFFLLTNIHPTVTHNLIKLFMMITGFPKPREAENYL